MRTDYFLKSSTRPFGLEVGQSIVERAIVNMFDDYSQGVCGL